MTKKTNIESWITAASKATYPLIFQASKGLYEAYAPLVTIPDTGTIYSGQRSGVAAERAGAKGTRFKLMGITTEISTTKPTWDVSDKALLKLISMDNLATTVAEPVETVVEPVAELVETIVEAPDFASMTKREIDAWAKENGIEVDGRMSKTDMVNFVKGELAK